MHAMNEDGATTHEHGHGQGMNGYTDGSTNTQRKPQGPRMRDTLATSIGMLLPLLTRFGHAH